MELSKNALTVLKVRYLLKDDQGRVIESPREMFGRIARSIAAAEERYEERVILWEERFFDLISSLRFLPNSPAIMNAGKPAEQLAHLGQVRGCRLKLSPELENLPHLIFFYRSP